MIVGGPSSWMSEAQRRPAEGQDLLSQDQLVACNQDFHHTYQDSPVAESRSTFPASLTDFCQQLQNRIKEQSVIHSTAAEDEQALTSVLTSELGLIWQGLREKTPDPMLTLAENQELRSRMVGEVLQLCQQLYLSYLTLLETLRQRGIFTDQANRIRLGAQLARDCTGLLNVRSIRHTTVARIKAGRLKAERCNDVKALKRENDLQAKRLRESSTPLDRAIQEMTEKMGELDLQRVYDLMPSQLDSISSNVETYTHHAQCVASPTGISSKPDQESQIWNKFCSNIKGYNSMPDLQRETPVDELKMEPLQTRPLSPLLHHHVSNHGTPLDPAEDLRRLVQDRVAEPEADHDPLISSMPWTASSNLQQLQKMLQKLEEKEEERMKAKRKAVLPEPELPQGDVVTVTLPLPRSPPQIHALPRGQDWTPYQEWTQTRVKSQPTVMVAPRIPDCILPETIDIQMYPPIDNHLTNEITPSTVKCLDRDISEGEETKEVHCEQSKSISKQYLQFDEEADYLSAIFHLYNSSDSDTEENEKMKQLQQRWEEKLKCRREKMEALKRRKQEYVTGEWNVNTVLLGGLWKDPTLEEEEESPEEEAIPGDKQVAQKGKEKGGPVDGDQIQSRLERIWTVLCLPDAHRLDMVIKYSSHAHRHQLEEAIVAWESAAHLIQQRETLMAHLELFETEASDPNRFFQRGYRGSSIARMEEAKKRSELDSQIASLDTRLSKIINNIAKRFRDTVSYNGRPYVDKMRWDRIEMLYWLQQQRRVQNLEKMPKREVIPLAQTAPLAPCHHQEHSQTAQQGPTLSHSQRSDHH